jgi:hypothetical protein
MALPDFNDLSELPHGVHLATLEEVCARFGTGTPQRQAVAGRLRRIYQVANGTGKLQRFIIFGSFVTAKPDPNDVDVVLSGHPLITSNLDILGNSPCHPAVQFHCSDPLGVMV